MKFIFTQFFNSCFIHNHFPEKLLAGVIRPCVKNGSGDFKSSSNYREIMISSNFMKVLEYIILPYIQTIPTNPRQFCYKKNTSTILATMILTLLTYPHAEAAATYLLLFFQQLLQKA